MKKLAKIALSIILMASILCLVTDVTDVYAGGRGLANCKLEGVNNDLNSYIYKYESSNWEYLYNNGEVSTEYPEIAKGSVFNYVVIPEMSNVIKAENIQIIADSNLVRVGNEVQNGNEASREFEIIGEPGSILEIEFQWDVFDLEWNERSCASITCTFKIVDGGEEDSSSEYTGLIYDEIQGWCYVENGKINYDYNGLKSNEYGWWKITGGKVDFGYTGLAFDEQVGWWFVNNGAIDFNFNGLALNEYGWWKITGGKVDFGYTGYASNEYGVWHFTNGVIDSY